MCHRNKCLIVISSLSLELGSDIFRVGFKQFCSIPIFKQLKESNKDLYLSNEPHQYEQAPPHPT